MTESTNTFRQVRGVDLLQSLRVSEAETVGTASSQTVTPAFNFLFQEQVLVDDTVTPSSGATDNVPQLDSGGTSDVMMLYPYANDGAELVGNTLFYTAVGRPQHFGRRLVVSGRTTSCHGAVPVQPFIFGYCTLGDGTGGTSPPTGQVDSFGIPLMWANTTLTSFKPLPWEMGVSASWDSPNKIDFGSPGTGLGFQGSGTSKFWDGDVGTGNIRYNVFAEDDAWTISTYNRATIASRTDPDLVPRGGYMANPSDWRNCEITMAIYLYPENNKSGGLPNDDTAGWYCRGGSHSDSISCEGFKYEPNIFYAGNANSDCNKETSHNGCGTNAKKAATAGALNVGDVVGKWVFWKTIWRNLPQNGFYPAPFSSVPLFPVHMQLWVIETAEINANNLPAVSLAAAGNWVLLGEWYDPYPSGTQTPNWGQTSDCCGGPDFAVGSWGGPEVTFRADAGTSGNPGYGHVRIAYASVREIDPTSQVNVLG